MSSMFKHVSTDYVQIDFFHSHLSIEEVISGGCNYTNINVPDSVKTLKLNVLGREQY